jgi:hypothetical protein
MPKSKEDDWYNWNCEHWGTKWDAVDVTINHDSEQGWIKDEGDVHLIYRFNTAWSPPLAWFSAIAQKWPKLRLLMNYCELGMDYSGQSGCDKGDTLTWESENLSIGDIIASEFEQMF